MATSTFKETYVSKWTPRTEAAAATALSLALLRDPQGRGGRRGGIFSFMSRISWSLGGPSLSLLLVFQCHQGHGGLAGVCRCACERDWDRGLGGILRSSDYSDHCVKGFNMLLTWSPHHCPSKRRCLTDICVTVCLIPYPALDYTFWNIKGWVSLEPCCASGPGTVSGIPLVLNKY